MKTSTKGFTVAMIVSVIIGTIACDTQSKTDSVQAKATEQMMAEANAQVGMPDIINFTELRSAKDILELRDKPELATFTYLVDMNGNLRPLCKSIGYGLPYSVQFTNPMKTRRAYQGGYEILPQPDPNGLFMPSGLSATWVLCMDPNTGQVEPLYVEPEIIVSRFELSLDGWDNPGGTSR